MHPFLQPQRSSSRQAYVTSQRVVQHIFPTAVFIPVPPHSLGDGSAEVAIVVCAKHILDRNAICGVGSCNNPVNSSELAGWVLE